MPEEIDEQEQIRKVMSIIGSRKSEAKTAAARENAKKAGRKPGTPMTEEQKANISAGKRRAIATRQETETA
jgi:hypothetical protein